MKTAMRPQYRLAILLLLLTLLTSAVHLVYANPVTPDAIKIFTVA